MEALNLLSHGQAGVHDFYAGGKRQGIVDLHSQRGHEGKRLEFDVGQVVTSRSIVRKLIVKAEAREQPQAQPQMLVELMG